MSDSKVLFNISPGSFNLKHEKNLNNLCIATFFRGILFYWILISYIGLSWMLFVVPSILSTLG